MSRFPLKCWSRTKGLIVPFPHRQDLVLFYKVFPVDLFPGGMHEIMVLLLECNDDADMFAQRVLRDLMDTINERVWYHHDENKVQCIIEGIEYDVPMLRLALHMFYDTVWPEILGLIGTNRFKICNVLNYRTIQGVAVELEY